MNTIKNTKAYLQSKCNKMGKNDLMKACIYPKDVQRILGKTYRQARLYLVRIRKQLGKEPHQLISIEEFCEYSGLQLEHIIRCLQE